MQNLVAKCLLSSLDQWITDPYNRIPMGFCHHFIPEHNFLLSTIEGPLDDAGLTEHVREVNELASKSANIKELSDCRSITDLSGLSVQGTVKCAQLEQDKPGSKLAIVVPRENITLYGMARAYHTFSVEKREDVQIFGTIEEAASWLAEDKLEAESMANLAESATAKAEIV